MRSVAVVIWSATGLALCSPPEAISAGSMAAASPEPAISQKSLSRSRDLRAVIRELTQEARRRWAEGLPADSSPDFASRTDADLPVELIQQAVLSRQHRDPFIDAYIRWQLLSFDPPFPDLDDRAYLRLLSELPAYVPNPKGDRDTMAFIDRAANSGQLFPSDFERLQQYWDDLEAQQQAAEQFNIPASALRRWVREGVEDSLARSVQFLLADCQATIDAAWPPRAIKLNLTHSFTRGADELTLAEKRLLADQTRHFIGRERRFVNTITFMADRTINVSYSTAQVTQSDYDQWMQRLAGEE